MMIEFFIIWFIFLPLPLLICIYWPLWNRKKRKQVIQCDDVRNYREGMIVGFYDSSGTTLSRRRIISVDRKNNTVTVCGT